MARFLSAKTLAGVTPARAAGLLSVAPAARLLVLRRRSGSPRKAELVELEIGAESSSSDIEVLGIRRLEDAIHDILVRRAAPDWLPFVPGASYWVPPRRRLPRDGVAELISRLTNPMTEDELMSFTSIRGWPSYAYFIEGASLPPPEKIQGRTKAQSDDEKTNS